MKKDVRLIKFGARLKELRNSVGKTQEFMGKLLNCTASNYQKIEYGEINAPATTLITLAEYFGVSVEYLLGRSDEGGPQN